MNYRTFPRNSGTRAKSCHHHHQELRRPHSVVTEILAMALLICCPSAFKDRLPNRHLCLNLYPCVIKVQSVSLFPFKAIALLGVFVRAYTFVFA